MICFLYYPSNFRCSLMHVVNKLKHTIYGIKTDRHIPIVFSISLECTIQYRFSLNILENQSPTNTFILSSSNISTFKSFSSVPCKAITDNLNNSKVISLSKLYFRVLIEREISNILTTLLCQGFLY